MAYTLDEFAADCRRILEADPGPAGRETVRKKLQDLLMNDDFVAAHCGPNASVGSNLLYEDPRARIPDPGAYHGPGLCRRAARSW
jgi:hypothetical protein